jgi:hypothetical protein
MTGMRRLLNEPVWLASALRISITLGAAFGLNLTDQQTAALTVFVEVVLAPIVRALVTPNQLAEARVAAGGSPTQPRSEP